MTTYITPRNPEKRARSRRWVVSEAGTTLASGRLTGTYKDALLAAKQAKDAHRTWCWGRMR